jgi:hypothetical protein
VATVAAGLVVAVALAQGPTWQPVLGADGSAPVARHEASLTEFGGALYQSIASIP